MKVNFLSNFLIKIYKKLIWREPCIVYRRPYVYNKWCDNGFSDKCPYCEDIFEKKYKYFKIMENKYPYPKTEKHLLLVPYKHIRTLGELDQQQIKELQTILHNYMEKWYTLLGRHFPSNKDASVEHLHIHLIKQWKEDK